MNRCPECNLLGAHASNCKLAPVSPDEDLSSVKKRLTYIAPLRAGLVLGILYGIGGLIAVPFFLFAAFAGKEGVVWGVVLAVMFPIIYTVGGFIGGIIASAIYNLVARWTGGLQFRVIDDALTD